MKLVGAVLVVLGYVVSLPIIFRFRAVFAERRTSWFAAFMAALVAIVVGYVLVGRPVAAALNAAAAVILIAAWWVLGRRADADAG